MWDLGSYQAGIYQGQEAGRGWLFEYPAGEDLTIDHNTFVAISGSFGNFVHQAAGTQPEGLTVTNNIIPISNAAPFNDHGLGADGLAQSSGGEAVVSNPNVAPWLNYQFHHNLLYPSQFSVADTSGNGRNGVTTFTSTETQASAQSFYPTLQNSNYFPAVTSFTQLGLFRAPAPPATNDSFYSGLDARALSGSLASSGHHGYPSTDGQDLGADLQAIRDAQGAVTLIGAPASVMTATSAVITFQAPDSQACPVDFKAVDPADPNLLNGFTRAADTGASRLRSVLLTGLTTQTTYAYRVDCAAQQPTGMFRTK